jgi:hypothetical protein
MKLDRSRTPGLEASGQESAFAAIRDSLGRLRFGSIELIVHDGRVVQLAVTEKRRFGH